VTCTTTFSGDYTAIGWQAPGDAAPVPSAGFKSWTLSTSSNGQTITIGNIGTPPNQVHLDQPSLDAAFGTGVDKVTINGSTISFNVGAQVCNGNACVSAPSVQVQFSVAP